LALPTTSHQSKEQAEQRRQAQIKIKPAITPGTGKTHLVEALAHAAIDTGRRDLDQQEIS
jgi:chromosomal replication initiation ATPase DnaA